MNLPRISRLAVALVLVAGFALGGHAILADEFDEQIDENQGELEKIDAQTQEARAFLAATQARRSALQSRLRVADEARYREIGKLQSLQIELDTAELEILSTERQVLALTADFEAEKAVIGGKLRALYKANRGLSSLEVLLSSGSFTEGLDKMSSLEAVVQQDFADIRDLLDRREEIRLRSIVLAAQRAEVVGLKAEREVVQVELDRRTEEHQALLDAVAEQEGQAEADIEAFEAEAAAINSRIDRLRAERAAEIAELERQRRIEEARAAAAAATGGGGWIWPLFGIITTEYGGCTFGQCPHVGMDIAAPLGTPILAATSGVILYADYAVPGDRRASYGMIVIIAHNATEETVYAHLADITLPPPVVAGQLVNVGQVIGYVGLTGWTTGPHLHFEYRLNGVQLNPRLVIG
ncbi:MAG: peptidoglycan DD-metalloendopeptidase family protein [Chloroflexota bacterium]|nr:peptidoglycan DD-metalloendopeptidase family protein [Chloroflexota bacterium]MDP6758477.1 peptidoglycan DD-metalloendopeptidase family protein [Chloroflexota bacterium]